MSDPPPFTAGDIYPGALVWDRVTETHFLIIRVTGDLITFLEEGRVFGIDGYGTTIENLTEQPRRFVAV